MRQSIIKFAPLALCACVGSAFADDSNVTVYGILDTAVANVEHSFNFDAYHPVGANPQVSHATQSATGMLNGGMSATRWGLKGSEDISSDLKAVFLLESAFNVGSGQISNAAYGLANNTSTTGPNFSLDSAISGQLFSRGAYAGLSSSKLGTLTFGRQQSFFLDNIAVFDPLMGSQAFSPIGFSGSYGGGGYTDDSRVDNAVKYKLNVSDFTLGLLYKFGGVAGATTAESAYQANLVYASGPLAVQVGYQRFDDAFSLTNASGTGTIKATAADTKAFMVAAKYSVEATKTTVRAGFEKETITNPSNWDGSAPAWLPSAILGQTVASGGYTAFGSTSSYVNDEKLNVFWIGGDQAITSAFSVLLGYYRVNQNQFLTCPVAVTSSNAKGCSGDSTFYSLVGDYRLSKRTDFYLGIMATHVSGGPANADINTSGGSETYSVTDNRTIALGIRHSF